MFVIISNEQTSAPIGPHIGLSIPTNPTKPYKLFITCLCESCVLVSVREQSANRLFVQFVGDFSCYQNSNWLSIASLHHNISTASLRTLRNSGNSAPNLKHRLSLTICAVNKLKINDFDAFKLNKLIIILTFQLSSSLNYICVQTWFPN